MTLEFTKMHGLGNDFVVLDGVSAAVRVDTALLRFLGDRYRGVGCDQILLVEPAGDAGDFTYRIFNADGGEVEQCGNGARCVARFVRDRGLSDADRITFSTLGGLIHTRLLADGRVAVDMGVPRFEPAEIPFEAPVRADAYPLEAGGETHEIGAVSMGNPHAVLRVEDLVAAPVRELGPVIEHHERFPRRANVGFMRVIDRERIALRVWERGAGETAACGTGACGAVAVGRLRGWLDERVTVALPGGELVIDWAGADNPLWMTGVAQTAFHGEIA
ncbi:MAG: diaminopimelate epimerase [Halofilum sp. (in: g-proteobacteria)]